MAERIDARRLIELRIGHPLKTVRGKPNRVLRIEDDSAIVETQKSPGGEPVPIEDVQFALDKLVIEGEVPIKLPLRRYRGSFVLAVLGSLPGVVLKANSSRAVVTDREALERFLYAETVPKQSPKEFKVKLATARQQARKAGLTKSDITAAVRKVRKRSKTSLSQSQ